MAIRSLTIPLHLAQDDYSATALTMRFDLQQRMIAIRPNGDGFRKAPSSMKGAKAIAKKKASAPTTRLEHLGMMLVGKGIN